MWSLLAVWTFSTSRRLFQLGILLGGVGAGFVGLAGLAQLQSPRAAAADAPAPGPRRSLAGPALIVAGVLMVAGLVLMILAVHYGTSPFSPRPH